jgi:3-oxoacyl-[acyl-carrier protein] reductase
MNMSENADKHELKGKTAIVTGAARGIGKAISLALAREGATVVVVDLNAEGAEQTAAEIRQAGLAAYGAGADVTQKQSVDRLVQETVSRTGRIDVLVNNAGVVSNTPVLDLSEEEWDRTLAVNLKGAFLCSQSVARVMASQRSGRIVNVSSLAGKIGAPGQAAYCASKHGVLGLTQVLAIDLAPFGINVNAICPGNTETEMMRYVFTKRAESRGQTFDELAGGILSKTPLGRFGRPDDVAQVVLFLVSPAAAYVTGQTLNVDGGRSINLS